MICAKCNHELKENAQFCGNCGGKVEIIIEKSLGHYFLMISCFIGILVAINTFYYGDVFRPGYNILEILTLFQIFSIIMAFINYRKSSKTIFLRNLGLAMIILCIFTIISESFLLLHGNSVTLSKLLTVSCSLIVSILFYLGALLNYKAMILQTDKKR